MQTLSVPLTTAARKPLAWALCVVSSSKQEETLPHQRGWASTEAKSKGWRLHDIFEGVASGKDGARSLVRDILKKLRATEPDARPQWLLMIRSDRIGREMVESQIVLRDLKQLGVKVWTRDQGELKLDTTMGKVYAAMQAGLAEQENMVRQDKMRNFRKQKREAGLQVGKAPYGILREKGVDSPDPKRAPVVKEAFSLRLQGIGYGVIGHRLAAIAPPHQYKKSSDYAPGGMKVTRWTPQRVRKLLQNHAYVDAGLIDETSFVRAQKVAKTLTHDRTGDNRRKHPWPLSGVLTCYCGGRLIGAAYGTNRYYACKAKWNHDQKLRLVRADELEAQFVDLLGRLDASPALIKRYRTRAVAPVSTPALERTLRDNNAKLADLAKRREKVWDLFESGDIRKEAIQERLDKLDEQREKLQSELEEAREQLALAKELARGQQDAEDLMRRAVKIFQKADTDSQNEIAKALRLTLGAFVVDAEKKLQVGSAIH